MKNPFLKALWSQRVPLSLSWLFSFLSGIWCWTMPLRRRSGNMGRNSELKWSIQRQLEGVSTIKINNFRISLRIVTLVIKQISIRIKPFELLRLRLRFDNAEITHPFINLRRNGRRAITCFSWSKKNTDPLRKPAESDSSVNYAGRVTSTLMHFSDIRHPFRLKILRLRL